MDILLVLALASFLALVLCWMMLPNNSNSMAENTSVAIEESPALIGEPQTSRS